MNENKKLPQAIKIQNLKFQYSKDSDLILNNLNLEIEQGTYNVFVGQNGSGKSTTTKLIANVLKQYDGEIEILGQLKSKSNGRKLQKKVGIVFDNPDFQLIGSTVEEDIIFCLENYNFKSELMPDIVHNVLTDVNMLDYRKTAPDQLSGGQKQKVALATVLAFSPEIIILDEAFSMLDYKSKKQIQNIISQLHKQKNRTIISVSHDMEELVKADNIFIFKNGNIIAKLTYKELINNKDLLLENGLELPFLPNLISELKNLNINVKSDDLNVESLATQLCLMQK
ncbi:energy-coupling factor transport system ATP-binding protein [Mycoplasma testudineum]|uniref:Energy-coupling factor transport system ATP-binding protein n=1 Tax=Mycoplasma testudineum TaxID=244584 RepID=A0A4R6ICZ4_9MOLU|nr:ATP-binding cassette domain-containing protein [Mycoplasma testudineum]OYD26621.1 energy-coupling factor transporter ATPase [Mycoplasma testudineum]TDO19457.1 energy-coupling factor transport system ATP-binding protein [Mycoplasma testudineum]